VLTSLRLENMVWDILAEMAEEEGCTTNALISNFHDEILAHRGEVPNFASFLRVTSMRYLRRCVINMEREQSNTVAVANVSNLPGRPQSLESAPKSVAAVGR
jgi:predicted DNA-binding ribbon-helix-helix protein